MRMDELRNIESVTYRIAVYFRNRDASRNVVNELASKIDAVKYPSSAIRMAGASTSDIFSFPLPNLSIVSTHAAAAPVYR